MRALLQRVRRAAVRVPFPPGHGPEETDEVVGEIGPGMVVLLGVGVEDTADAARILAGRVAHLRIFADDRGRLKRSILDSGGQILSV